MREQYGEILKALGKLVSFRTVEGSPEEDAPFGGEIRRALRYVLDLGESMGFETVNYDNYLGEIAWGEGEELGVIGHIDVVPEGDGWHTPPYEMTYFDDRVAGRGVTDDKGPTLICLYAMKSLKDAGVRPRRRVRFFIGCNEETGWKDIAYFTASHRFPRFGFSPDGEFPVVYAEKGPNKLEFVFSYRGRFTDLKGGVAPNAVCAYATVNGPVDEALLKKHGLTHRGTLIESVGQSAHGSMPELGRNAIHPIVSYMLEMGEPVQPLLDLFEDRAEISKQGNFTGHATISPNIVSQDASSIRLTVDFRVPAMMKAEDFFPRFDTLGIPYTCFKSRDPLYVPQDSEIVVKLLAAYNEVMGTNEAPVSQCGGTFASVFEQGVAFGPEFKGENCHIHEPDEILTYRNVDIMYRIYRRALEKMVTE